MFILGEFWRKFRLFVHRDRLQSELDEEMRFHLDMKAQEAGGGADARNVARRQFGNFTLLKELSREMWTWNSLETLMQDIRYALRAMRRSPGFTAIVIATLALGIGANTAIFSVVDGVLLRPLPFPDQERLVAVYSYFAPPNVLRGTFSEADFLDLHAQNRSFDKFAAYTFRRSTLTGLEQPELIANCPVTSEFFSVLGARPLFGGTFDPADDKSNGPQEAVLSEELWKRRFAGDRGVIGRSIVLNGTSYTILGVMPASFQFPQRGIDLWTLMRIAPPRLRFPFFFRGIAHLKTGVSLEQAQSDVNAIAHNIERSDPKTYKHLTFPVFPLREGLVGNVRTPLLVLLGAVVLVLLIASVNVANLLLARAASREREIAVRISIGASRARLVRQLLTESIVISLAGAVAGTLLAWWGVAWFRTFTIMSIPRLGEVRIDGRILGFTLAVSVLSGLAFGLVPALESLRYRLNESLKQHERSGTESLTRRRTRSVLVAAEVALSFMLLIGAGLLLRSFVALQSVDPGFSTENLLTARISPTGARYSDGPKMNMLFDELLRRLPSLPGVKSVALAGTLPPDRIGWMEGFRIEGRSQQELASYPAVTLPVVTPEYFRTMGIPLLRGRYFTERDTPTSPPVVIISDTMARRYFPNQDPIGKRLMMGWSLPNQPWREIVGVVGDVKYRGLDADPEPAYYAPLNQNPNTWAYIVVRAPNAGRLADAVRSAVWSIDKDLPISNVGTMEQSLSESVAQPRFRTALLAIFGGVALLLAAIGIYGVVSYSVTQRRHEFGIRLALGAQSGDVIALVARWSALLVVVGMAAGIAGSLALTRLLRTLLYHVSPADPLTFAAVVGILGAVALLASVTPARRATQIDPIATLRDE